MKLSPLYHHCSDHLSDRPQIPPRRAESLQWRHRSATWAMASWRRVQDKTWLKHGWNMVETWLKHGWNMVETWLKHGWNMVETWLKHGWNPFWGCQEWEMFFLHEKKSPKKKLIPASSKVGVISAFCPINMFCTRTTFLVKPEFLLLYCCQARFSAAKLPDQAAKIPDHVGWQFLTAAFIFRNDVFPQERQQF